MAESGGSQADGNGEQTLYERLGGEAAITRLMGDFYDRVLADPELAPFFEGVEMDKLRRMQREFFAAALGGPVLYSGRGLAEVHAGRGIEVRHLRRFLDHLFETLRAHDITEVDAYEVVSRINLYADEITGNIPGQG
ncbi:MAG: group 1 truncated hemoglobin [Myxococcota bacterium]|nr:group 1 truncated hemoglobin [Myxococcota bacterium]